MSNQFYPQKFYFRKFHFFQNFISFYLVLFYLINLKKIRNFFVMNSVHEQCPNSGSETVLSQKLGQIESGAPSTQSGPTSAHRPRPGRTRVVVSWPTQCRVVGPSWPCRRRLSAVSQPQCRAPVLPLSQRPFAQCTTPLRT